MRCQAETICQDVAKAALLYNRLNMKLISYAVAPKGVHSERDFRKIDLIDGLVWFVHADTDGSYQQEQTAAALEKDEYGGGYTLRFARASGIPLQELDKVVQVLDAVKFTSAAIQTEATSVYHHVIRAKQNCLTNWCYTIVSLAPWIKERCTDTRPVDSIQSIAQRMLIIINALNTMSLATEYMRNFKYAELVSSISELAKINTDVLKGSAYDENFLATLESIKRCVTFAESLIALKNRFPDIFEDFNVVSLDQDEYNKPSKVIKSFLDIFGKRNQLNYKNPEDIGILPPKLLSKIFRCGWGFCIKGYMEAVVKNFEQGFVHPEMALVAFYDEGFEERPLYDYIGTSSGSSCYQTSEIMHRRGYSFASCNGIVDEKWIPPVLDNKRWLEDIDHVNKELTGMIAKAVEEFEEPGELEEGVQFTDEPQNFDEELDARDRYSDYEGSEDDEDYEDYEDQSDEEEETDDEDFDSDAETLVGKELDEKEDPWVINQVHAHTQTTNAKPSEPTAPIDSKISSTNAIPANINNNIASSVVVVPTTTIKPTTVATAATTTTLQYPFVYMTMIIGHSKDLWRREIVLIRDILNLSSQQPSWPSLLSIIRGGSDAKSRNFAALSFKPKDQVLLLGNRIPVSDCRQLKAALLYFANEGCYNVWGCVFGKEEYKKLKWYYGY